jgi:ubiquinone/menaquinone biosynthesis C-methylase UbiE
MAERRRLRATFEEVPEVYDRARPLYPAELFDDLAALAGLEPGSRVLEIGCGTGQATLPLAARGFEVVCVELGEGLAAVARRKLAGFPNVEVVNAVFEEWEAREASFDAVVAFTAFHWVDPEVKYEKASRVLRPGGSLAVTETEHVLLEKGDPFWTEVQADYDAAAPNDRNRPPPRPEEVGDLRAQLEESGLFTGVQVRRYLADVTYSAEEYIAVLDTYSPNRAMEESGRLRLYDLIRRRIEARPSQTVRKTYLFTLNLARRL